MQLYITIKKEKFHDITELLDKLRAVMESNEVKYV